MTTNEYIRGAEKYDWVSFYRKLWQHNYSEHIIRNAECERKLKDPLTPMETKKEYANN